MEVVTFTRRTGTTAGGQVLPLKFEEVFLMGRHVGHLWPTGSLSLIRILSPADKNLVEVACAQHCNVDDTNASQSSQIEQDDTPTPSE